MGFVPSEAEETPLDWYPEHIEQHLRENVNVENWILVLMRARLRARSTEAARGQGTPLDGELWQRPRDGGGRVVWGSDRGLGSRRRCARSGWSGMWICTGHG